MFPPLSSVPAQPLSPLELHALSHLYLLSLWISLALLLYDWLSNLAQERALIWAMPHGRSDACAAAAGYAGVCGGGGGAAAGGQELEAGVRDGEGAAVRVSCAHGLAWESMASKRTASADPVLRV